MPFEIYITIYDYIQLQVSMYLLNCVYFNMYNLDKDFPYVVHYVDFGALMDIDDIKFDRGT